MNEKLMEKIIGASYVAHNEKLFIADIYEGNYYKILEGGTVKTISLPKREYDRIVAQYQECVRKDIMITSAYEMNKRTNLSYDVPAISADPEAAEKEWYIRKHPQIVAVEDTGKKKRGLFSRKKKGSIGIKCLECGAINKDGQKFCGECGAKLMSANEEIPAAKPTEPDPLMPSENTTPPSAPEKEVPAPTPIPEPEPEEEIQILNLDDDFDDISEDDDLLYEEDPVETPNEEVPNENPPETKPSPEHRADKKPETKVRRKAAEQEQSTEPEKPIRKARRKKKKRVNAVIIIFLFLLLFLGCGAAGYILLYGGGINVVFDSQKHFRPSIEQEEQTEEVVEPVETPSTEVATESFVVIKVKNNIRTNQKITEDDLEGTILNSEQFEKYNQVSTYVASDGQLKPETLLLWEDRDDIIGKYAARELSAGSILYDTAITSQHVVADKTYVDVDINGETKSYETDTNVLPGNTKIQIVAIVQTDNGQPSQILLSEMMLQDRSLQSIFDSAGKDILDMLSNESTDDAASTEDPTSVSEETEVQ